MIRGLPASIVFHAALVGISYLGWPFLASSSRDYDSDAIQIPVELVDIGALNNIAPVLRPEPEPEEDIAPEVPEEEPEEDVIPEEDPDPVDETLPEDDIDTASAQEEPEEAEPEEVVPDLDAKPDETEKEPEPEEPTPAVQKANPLDDFLNDADNTFQSERQTRKRREEPKPIREPLLQDTPPIPQEVRRGAGERTANTIRLEGLLYAQVKSCWIGVDDLAGAEDLNVEMQILISEDGYLREDVKLISPSRAPLGRSPMRTAVERAQTAVRKCQPYRLPKQEYADWDDYNTIRLGPKYEQD